MFGFGAPMQFYNFGFFDKANANLSSSSSALFDRVVDGDTMLLLSLRHHIPHCAIALIKLGASLHISNSVNESPLQGIFDVMAFLRLHPDEEKLSNARIEKQQLIKQRAEYEALFSILQGELTTFYDKQRTQVERELQELYQQFAPDRVSKIPSQLEAYAYRELELLEIAKKKYM